MEITAEAAGPTQRQDLTSHRLLHQAQRTNPFKHGHAGGNEYTVQHAGNRGTCIIDPSGPIKSNTCSASTTQTTSLALVPPFPHPCCIQGTQGNTAIRDTKLFRRTARLYWQLFYILSELAQTENNTSDQSRNGLCTPHLPLTHTSTFKHFIVLIPFTAHSSL